MSMNTNTLNKLLKTDGDSVFHPGVAGEIAKVVATLSSSAFTKIRRKSGLNVEANAFVAMQKIRAILARGKRTTPSLEFMVKAIVKDASARSLTNARNKLRDHARKGLIGEHEYPVTVKNKYGQNVVKTFNNLMDENLHKRACLRDMERCTSTFSSTKTKWESMRGTNFSEWASDHAEDAKPVKKTKGKTKTATTESPAGECPKYTRSKKSTPTKSFKDTPTATKK